MPEPQQVLPRGVAALPVGGSDGRHVRGRGPAGSTTTNGMPRLRSWRFCAGARSENTRTRPIGLRCMTPAIQSPSSSWSRPCSVTMTLSACSRATAETPRSRSTENPVSTTSSTISISAPCGRSAPRLL
ncbi:hypothetical protein BC477_10540 [Clavibacter michiganensis subsp. michiganensis]|uniref:Uncharacterized protein n=1 Tax=Clavibacter michiganensis subsp. michiganensis TaxID=33013 RepID=A0A251XNT2_CLAMM|nr:hypothetical protein BC477_10540 [Clavibacter michiganensis subsp. michiganensis]OUE05164.1 hypothetical protein CMMCAS07_09460 [Clavibacter michiganensis subsp. michiganensis]